MLCKNGADLKTSVVSLSAKMYIHPTQLPEWMLASVCFWKPRMCWNFRFLSAAASLSFRFIFSFMMWQDCVMPQMRQEIVPTSRQKQPFYCHKLNLKISPNSSTAWRGFFLVTNVEMPPRTSASLDSHHAELLHHYHPHHIREHGVTHIESVLWHNRNLNLSVVCRNINVSVDSGNFRNLCSPGSLFLKRRSDQTW